MCIRDSIKGTANGTFNIKMDRNNLEPLVDLDITDIFMNGKDMGNVVINVQKSACLLYTSRCV